MPERITDSELNGSSRMVRPKLRWMDGVVRYLGIRRGCIVARKTELWKMVLRAAEALSCL